VNIVDVASKSEISAKRKETKAAKDEFQVCANLSLIMEI
jgi:hypothetical protein